MKGSSTQIAAFAVLAITVVSLAIAAQELQAPPPSAEAALADTSIDPANSHFGNGFEPYIRFSITPAASAIVPALDANSIYNHPLVNVTFETHYKDGTIRPHATLEKYRWEQLQNVTSIVTRYNQTQATLENGTIEHASVPYTELVTLQDWVASNGPYGAELSAGRTYEYRLVAPADAMDFDNIKFVKWTACVVNKCLDPQWTAYAEIANLSKNFSSTNGNPWFYQYFQANGTRINMTYSTSCNEPGSCWKSGESELDRLVAAGPAGQNVTISTGTGGGNAFPNTALLYYFTQNGNYTLNGTFWQYSGFCNQGGMNYTVYLNGSGGSLKCSGQLATDCNANAINCNLGTDIPAGAFLEFDIGSNADNNNDYGNLTLMVYGALSYGGDGGKPAFANASAQVNQTDAGRPTKFSINVSDDVGLSTYVTAIDDGNGTFVNSTPILITGTANQTAFNYTINGTPESTIRWYVWANNTAGLGSTAQTIGVVFNQLETDLNGVWSTANGNPWFYQYYQSNGTRINMTQSNASCEAGTCWQSGESSQDRLVNSGSQGANTTVSVGSAGGGQHPRTALLYYFHQNGNYTVNGTFWQYSGFCNLGDGMSYTVYVNGSGGTQACSSQMNYSCNAFSIDCHIGSNLPDGAFMEFDIGSNAGSNYDYGNLTLQVLRNGTGGLAAYSFTTTTQAEAVLQPMTVYGYFTGESSANATNVTAYIDGMQKGVFNVTTSGQYGLFDVQGNGTDYGRALWLYADNDTARNVSTAFIPGRTERQDLAT